MLKIAAILALLALPAYSQLDPNLGDRLETFTMHWNGSLAGGNKFTIAVPSATYSSKWVYPIGCSIISDVDTTVTVRFGSSNNPTTATQAAVGVNTNASPVFLFYPTSDVTGGSIVTTVPVYAKSARFISLTGMRFAKGMGGATVQYRNVTFEIAAATGTVYNTCTVGQRQ